MAFRSRCSGSFVWQRYVLRRIVPSTSVSPTAHAITMTPPQSWANLTRASLSNIETVRGAPRYRNVCAGRPSLSTSNGVLQVVEVAASLSTRWNIVAIVSRPLSPGIKDAGNLQAVQAIDEARKQHHAHHHEHGDQHHGKHRYLSGPSAVDPSQRP